VLWGLQLGVIEGLMAASVADSAPDELRGTGLGVYYLLIGTASLAASSAAGAVWAAAGAQMAFWVGAALAILALLLIVAGRSRMPAPDCFERFENT
jgi:MFS family permease